MNKSQLTKIEGYRVRLRPPAVRADELGPLPPIDDDWVVVDVSETTIKLSNTRTSHTAILGLDHIQSYTSDPQRDIGTLKHGFLRLHVQLTLKGQDVLTEVLPSPNSRAAGPNRDPYAERLERTARQVLFYEMTLQGRHLLRHLLQHEPIEVGSPFWPGVPIAMQNEQLALAFKRGIIQHRGKRAGVMVWTYYVVNPQFRPVLERVLFESD